MCSLFQFFETAYFLNVQWRKQQIINSRLEAVLVAALRSADPAKRALICRQLRDRVKTTEEQVIRRMKEGILCFQPFPLELYADENAIRAVSDRDTTPKKEDSPSAAAETTTASAAAKAEPTTGAEGPQPSAAAAAAPPPPQSSTTTNTISAVQEPATAPPPA